MTPFPLLLAPQDHKIVTGALGYAYRGYNRVLLALHAIEPQHAGTYVCEASNEAGVDSAAIRIIVGEESLFCSRSLETKSFLPTAELQGVVIVLIFDSLLAKYKKYHGIIVLLVICK